MFDSDDHFIFEAYKKFKATVTDHGGQSVESIKRAKKLHKASKVKVEDEDNEIVDDEDEDTVMDTNGNDEEEPGFV